MIEHPIRKLDIRSFSNPKHGWIAQFGDGRAFPVVFRGNSEGEVYTKATDFRQGVIDKHEATYISRKRMSEASKARAAAKKKALTK